jgi:hypothetical protein
MEETMTTKKSKHNENPELENEMGAKHDAPKEAEFQRYRKNEYCDMRPYLEGEDMAGIQVGVEDARNGSPRKGDMIAQSPSNSEDRWLVSEADFVNNYGE